MNERDQDSGAANGPQSGPPDPSADQLREMNERLLLSGIREQEAAEEAERYAAQMEALLQSISSGVLVLDADGRISVMNAVAEDWFPMLNEGELWSAEHASGLELRDPEADEALPFERWPLSRALAGEAFSDVELAVLTPDGSRHRISFNGSVVRDDDGEVELAMVICRDVTELRELEKLRAEYTSMISHDLRSPLNAIAGYAGLLETWLEERGADDQAEHAGTILGAVETMDGMIQDLREATQLESGGFDLHPVPTDLRDLVAETIEEQIDIDKRGRIDVEAADELPPVAADRGRVSRALTNLLTNALKYSPPGTPVTIRLGHEDDEVVCAVIDRGRGIPDEELTHLFDRFYRAAQEEREDSTDGLGLGLYITRLIIEQHDGRIGADSEVGEGSVFRFALPVEV